MNDAGTAFVGVEPDLRGFGRQLAGQVDPHIDKSAAHVESRFGGAFSAVAKVAGGIFAAKFGIDLFKDVIGGASDLNETISKSNTIFGSNAKEIENWASSAAKSIGQSKQGALDAAATFGNLFVQLGTGSGEAAKMSKEMVGLASDFASFHNADPSDVIESMTAAFRGEYDAVQRYVPTITAAAVEQQALKMGLAASTKELTAQDKALATQALLMQGAGAAVGDFARTSDGLANRQRILSAQFQDLKDRIGTALLPVVLRLMEGFVGLGRVVGPIATQVGTAIQFLRSGFLEGNVSEGTGLMGVMVRFGAIARQVFDFIRSNAQPILIGLGAAFVAITAPLAGVVAGLVYAYARFQAVRDVVGAVASFLTGTVAPAIGAFAGFVSEQFSNLAGYVREHWAAIQEAIGHVVVVVQAIIANFVAVVQAVWRAWGDEILNVATIVWDQVRNVIETVVGVISGLIAAGLAVINGDWGAAWDEIKGVLGTAWDFIVETLGNALRLAREVVEGGISAIVGLIGDVPGQVLDALGNVDDLLFGAGRAIINGLKNGIIDAVQGVYDFVSGIAGKIADLKGPLDYDRRLLVPAGKAIMDGLVGGLRDHEGHLVRQLAHMTGMVQSVNPSVELAATGSSRAGGAGGGMVGPDVDRFAAAVAAALKANPPTAIVYSSDVSRAQYGSRRR